jgi:acetylornithine deacetylase/succinyl-diaminopimelate desuccinylase-like protein
MDIDMRSESCAELDKVEKQFLALVKEAVDEENKTRSTKEGPISAAPQKIGDRPCGETPVNSPLVQTVTSVVSAFGLKPNYNRSSTDSNLPMSLGIPAVTIGRGPGGRSHSLDEFTIIEPKADVRAAQVALAVLLAVAGVK